MWGVWYDYDWTEKECPTCGRVFISVTCTDSGTYTGETARGNYTRWHVAAKKVVRKNLIELRAFFDGFLRKHFPLFFDDLQHKKESVPNKKAYNRRMLFPKSGFVGKTARLRLKDR